MSLRITVLGLSLTSSWGNGHATTYRALLKALANRGHNIHFLEADRPWYAGNRDLPDPDFCCLSLYENPSQLSDWQSDIANADLTIIGSYVPDAIVIAHLIRPWARLLAFYDIDTPVTLAALRAGTCAYLNEATIPLYDLYLSFTGGPTLAHLENHYGAQAARALYCAADPALYHPQPATASAPRWDLGYLGTYSADRQPTLETLLLEPARLAPHRRFVVAGPQYPTTIDWPANVDRIEHLPPRDHAAFYANQRFTLNVTRADMIAAGHSPSVRLFEASACATAIISDVWDGLTDLFAETSEIILARTTADILAALDMPDEKRRSIGHAAYARFLAKHTADHRARELEAAVEERAGWDVPSPPEPPSSQELQAIED
jgi:spore maturation protein CgeB